jgi:hypothetical protein
MIAFAVIVALSASRLWLLPMHFSPDPNEGWNAFQALRATGAGLLYPPADALTGNNYPPLSFLLIGAIGRLMGDQIIAGRLVALGSVVGIAGLIAVIVRRLGGGRGQATGGGLLFLLLNATLLRQYLALDDPQWLGHLLMTAALPLLIPARAGEAPSARRVAGAALLMIAGGLVKQNLVAWPVAVTLWLALHHRRALGVWLASAAVAGGAALIACRMAYGPTFVLDTLGMARDYSVARMVRRSVGAVAVMVPLTWWAWPLARLRKNDERIDLILIAVLVAVPLGIVQRSGAGVDINAHFEAFIALSIAAPLVVVRPRRERRIGAVVLVALAIAGALLEAKEVSQLPRRRAEWDAMERRIAAIPGPVACEVQALCYWAGKEFELDFFLYSQRALKAGRAPLLDRVLEERRWAGVMIGPDGAHNAAERGRDPVVSRVARAMRPIFIDSDGRRLMVPR